MERIVPESYFLSLAALDGIRDPSDFMSLATSVMEGMNETVTTLYVNQPLPHRRLWNCKILALGCKDNPVTDAFELSKLFLAASCTVILTCTHARNLKVLMTSRMSVRVLPALEKSV